MECGVGLHTRIFSSFLQRDKGPQANIAQHTSQKIHFFIVHLHLEEWPRVNVTMLSSRYFSSSKKELCWCLDRNFCAIHSIQCHFYRRSLYFFFESLYARIHLKRSAQDTKFTNQARTSYTTILTNPKSYNKRKVDFSFGKSLLLVLISRSSSYYSRAEKQPAPTLLPPRTSHLIS